MSPSHEMDIEKNSVILRRCYWEIWKVC